jgi:hypothetical protein
MNGSGGAMVTLPAVDEIATNLGEGVLALRSGYAAWKRASAPSTLTWATQAVRRRFSWTVGWPRYLKMLAHGLQRRINRGPFMVRNAWTPRNQTCTVCQNPRERLTGVGDDDVEPAGNLLDLLDSRAVVRLVRRRELDDVELVLVGLCERLELRRRRGLPRAREDDDVRAGDERLDEREAWEAIEK